MMISQAESPNAMKHKYLTVTLSALALLLLAAAPARAQILWDAGGTTDDWSDGDNWSTNTVPISTDDVQITSASSAAHPATITTPAVANSLNVGPASGNNGFLDIQGNLTVGGSFILHAKGTGTVTQSAGTLTATTLYLSNSTNATGAGSYVLSGTGSIHTTGDFTAIGGTGSIFTQSGAGTSVQVDGNITSASGSAVPGDRWTYQISGGSLTVNGSVNRFSGAWLFQQSGGAVSIGTDLTMSNGYRNNPADNTPFEWIISGNSTLSIGGDVVMGWVGDGGTHTGTNSTGEFTLDGSRGSGSDVTVGGNWRQTGSGTPNTTGSLGTLHAIIDDDAISLASNMRLIDVTGDVTFDLNSYILPEFNGLSTPTGGTWTILTWSGILTDNGLMLDPSAASGWSFTLDDTNKLLSITYAIPEPGTPSLLAAAALVLIVIGCRRSRATT